MEVNTPPTRSYQNLRVYRYTLTFAEDLFWITRRFPREEQHALTTQLRRTARAITQNVLLAWEKRYSGATFRAYLAEAQSACARLGLWLDLAREYHYLTAAEHTALSARKVTIQRRLTRLYEQRLILLAGDVT